MEIGIIGVSGKA